jgi:hypothetical protein
MTLPELPKPANFVTPEYAIGYTEAQMLAFQRDTVEACAEAACGEVAFNGGSVQMEAHVRQAIRSLK